MTWKEDSVCRSRRSNSKKLRPRKAAGRQGKSTNVGDPNRGASSSGRK